MAKIRVHELAKELERDNKEIIAALQKLGVEVKSHMSNVEDAEAGKIRGMFARKTARPKEEEQMQQNPEKDLEKNVGKTPEAEGGVEAPPKKKNIIQVFRPQNSKTGMVKPGSRPRPQGQSGARPQGQPGMRPQGQPGMRPQGQPGARPQGQPGMRPQGQPGMRPQGQPGVRPQGQPGVRPQGQPGVRPQGQPGVRPQGQPGVRPQGQPGVRPQGQPGVRPQGQPGMRPQEQTGAGMQGQPGVRPQSQPGMRPQEQTGAGMQGQPGVRPQSQPGMEARSQMMAGAHSQPEGKVQAQPDTAGQSQTPANTKSQTAAESQPLSAVMAKEQAGAQAQQVSGQQGEIKAQEATAVNSPARQESDSARQQGSRPLGDGQGSRPLGDSQGRSQGGRPSGDGQGRSQGGRPSGDSQGRSQGGRPSGDSQGRSQGGRPSGDSQGRSQGGRYSGDGQGRSQGSRYSGDNQGRRNQGGRPSGDGQGRSQGGRLSGDGQGRSQGGRYSGDSQGRSQGGRYSGDGQGRSQGGRYSGDGQGRSQGGRYSGDGQNRGQGGRPSGIPKAPVESKPLEKESRKRTERGDRNRGDKGDKFDRLEKTARQNQKGGLKKGQQARTPAPKPAEKPEEVIRNITIPEKLTISELAEAMKVQPSAIVKKLFLQGTMVTVNQEVDFDKAEEIALEFNCICEKEVKVNVIEELLREEEDPEETLVPRSPVVCVMGHVDHGKTSLLDAIRNTHVIDKEAGGITQHIGAYVVSVDGQKITFLDTPGHEAFTAMRMRGANATDIAILVVAADDGVMPQTIEAISHAKAAGIEIIVAINKIDKPSANVERVKQELTEYELVPEDWGGNTIFVPVSAHTHEGIDTLLEMILLTAEVSELRANPKRKARGLVIEAELDKGKGPVATVLVQKGTLRVGDPVAAGSCYGKVRAMMDDKGRRVKEAGPSTPVEILGLSDVPNAGEIFMSLENEKEARNFAETFISEGRERLLEDTKARMSLDDLFSQIQAGSLKELDIIVKADVQGSVEAVKQSLLKLSNDEVIVKIIHGGVGAINESDVILASASNAIIIGFNVRPDAMSKATAEREGVDIRLYRVIYDAIADVEAAMKGMLDPIFEEKVIGHAEVRQTFKASGVGTIAGAYVTDGVFQRNCSVRISREDSVIYEGSLASLRRFKDDVKEVRAGYECGLVFEKFNDIKEEDKVEAYVMVEVPR